MTEYPAEGEIEQTEASLMIEEDIRDLLLGYENMDCPSCEDNQMTFQDDGGGIEAFCEDGTEPACRLIYYRFESNEPEKGSLEEWMQQYDFSTLPSRRSGDYIKIMRIVTWWQQADKPWKGHDKKNVHEIALDAIVNVFTIEHKD